MWDGSGQIASLSPLKSPHRAWRHNSEFSAFAIGRFSSWIAVLTHRLRQGHKPATDRVPPYRRYRCIYSYSASITPRRPAFVSCCWRSLRSLSCSPLSWRFLASAVIPSGATVLFLLGVSRFRPFRRAHPFSYCPLAFGWRGVASRHFRHLPRPSPRWSMPRAPWFFSCGRATAPPVIGSPVHLPRDLRPAPQAHSRPSSSISRFHSRMYCHAFLCSRHSVSGELRVVKPFILARYPPQGKAYPDPEWSSRSSPVTIRCQEGVSGSRVVQPSIFTRYPPLGRRIRTPSCPAVHLYSPSAARKAYPDRGWSRRSSSLAIRRQEGVSGPRLVQAFIVTRYPPPARRTQTPSGPAVHLHSLFAARKAHPDPEWSSRSSSIAIRRQEGAPRPRVVQPFIFTRYPSPGRRIRTPSDPGVHPHSLSAARKAYRDSEWTVVPVGADGANAVYAGTTSCVAHMTLLPGRDLGSELRQASVHLGSVPRCAATL